MVQSCCWQAVIQQALAPSAQPAPVTPEATATVPSPIPGVTCPICNCHLPCHYHDGHTETEQGSDKENIDIHADSDSGSRESQLAQDQGRPVDTAMTTAVNTSTTNPLGTSQSNQGYLTQKAKNVAYNICHFFKKEVDLTTCLPCMSSSLKRKDDKFSSYNATTSHWSTDILAFWEGSTVPCKHVFSSGTNTDTKKHNHICPTLMEALQMLKFWLKKDCLHFMREWVTSEREMVHDKDTEDVLGCLAMVEGSLNEAMAQAINTIASAEGDIVPDHPESSEFIICLHYVVDIVINLSTSIQVLPPQILQHPDFHQVAAFFMGWVFTLCTVCTVYLHDADVGKWVQQTGSLCVKVYQDAET
ncbi:hypothetical protein EDC04DRAFT_2597912 [Pisolithus marmoratus]|nr:hypothetical protein EDC04DRAFT_2597912 [Pisolithus marmoratus]